MADTNPLGEPAFNVVRARNKKAADDLLAVEQGKHAVSREDPTADHFTRNRERAKGWTDGSLTGQHSENQ